MSLRRTNPRDEMAYMTVVDNEIRWHIDQATAEQYAEYELQQAKEGQYHVTVFVLKCLKQGNEP